MATKKPVQTVEIVQPEFETVEFTIVGTTPLIVHAWSAKAIRMILEKQTKTASKGKHEIKIPGNDFKNAAYWLTEMPEDGADDAESESNYLNAVAAGAHFGFPVTGIKQSAITGAARGGLDVKMTELRGAFYIEGATDFSTPDLAEIVGPDPVMRRDMVKVGGMSKVADIRFRPEWKEWSIPLRMTYNKNGKYSLEQLLACFSYGGFVTGIGEWRPERDGQFGMYEVQV